MRLPRARAGASASRSRAIVNPLGSSSLQVRTRLVLLVLLVLLALLALLVVVVLLLLLLLLMLLLLLTLSLLPAVHGADHGGALGSLRLIPYVNPAAHL